MTNSETFNLETESFLASGVGKKSIADAARLFERLQGGLEHRISLSEDIGPRARQIFDALWKEKPNRYRSGGNYRLDQTLRCQLDPNEKVVGNCLGLTVLYNCLARRFGVNVNALHVENAFGGGPHVLSHLTVTGGEIHIEHMFPSGFDTPAYRNNPEKKTWGDRELVADMYLSRGNDCFENRMLDEAKACYDRALELNPRYEKARLNRIIVLDALSLPSSG